MQKVSASGRAVLRQGTGRQVGEGDGSAETVRRKLSPKKAVSSMEYDYVLGMNQTRLRVKV